MDNERTLVRITPDGTEQRVQAEGHAWATLSMSQEWQQTPQERLAAELAQRYHEETEAFDRTVCTGPIIDGAIQPYGPGELVAINRHALAAHRRIMAEAAAQGISAADMRRAITRAA